MVQNESRRDDLDFGMKRIQGENGIDICCFYMENEVLFSKSNRVLSQKEFPQKPGFVNQGFLSCQIHTGIYFGQTQTPLYLHQPLFLCTHITPVKTFI